MNQFPSQDEAEVWMPTVQSPNYMVSNYGRILSLARAVTAGGSGGSRLLKTKLIEPCVCKAKGYKRIVINRRSLHLHRVVLEAFVGPCPPGHECAHNDGDRTNARLDNLRWATRADNMADKLKHGTAQRGSANGYSKLTEQDVMKIRSDPRSRAEISRDYGVTPEAISKIVLRTNWKWL